jgi:multidrug transporter EmrE-like cation transporter
LRLFFNIALFFSYAAMSCYGLYLLKISESITSRSFLIGGVLYAFGAFIWLLILRSLPLSMAFPVASGLLMLGTSLIGFSVLKESFSLQSALGIVLILSGIVFLSVKVDME